MTAGEEPATATLTYHATIEFKGAAKLAAPVAKVVFEKIGNDTENSLTRILGAPGRLSSPPEAVSPVARRVSEGKGAVFRRSHGSGGWALTTTKENNAPETSA